MVNLGNARIAAKGVVTLMNVLFNGEVLEISASLADARSVDRLIKALEANKVLLPEDATVKSDEGAD